MLPKLTRSLAFDDEIAVAGPVLTRSDRLSDADLVENASTKSQDHLPAIAQRLKLSEKLTTSWSNAAITASCIMSGQQRRHLARGLRPATTRAQHDRKLMMVLGQRGDIPRQHFSNCSKTPPRPCAPSWNPQSARCRRDPRCRR